MGIYTVNFSITIYIDEKKSKTCSLYLTYKLAKIREIINNDHKITNNDFVFKSKNGDIVNRSDENSDNLSTILDNNKLYISTQQEFKFKIDTEQFIEWLIPDMTLRDVREKLAYDRVDRKTEKLQFKTKDGTTINHKNEYRYSLINIRDGSSIIHMRNLLKKTNIMIDENELTYSLDPEDKLEEIRQIIITKGITNKQDFDFKRHDGTIVKRPDEENSINLSKILKNNTLYISTLQYSRVTVCFTNNNDLLSSVLPKDRKLSEIRKKYETANQDFYIGSNSYFLEQDEKTVIPKSQEDERILKEILKFKDNKSYLYIVRKKEEPDWIKFDNEYKHVFIIERDLVKQVSINNVFTIKEKERKGQSRHIEKKTFECKNEFQELCYRNFIDFGNVTSILPWASICLGLDKETLSKKLKCYNEKIQYSYIKKICAKMTINKENICLTPEFKDDVKAALNEETQEGKIAKLRDITKKYGYFYASSICFGGVAVQKNGDMKNSDENVTTNHLGMQSSAGFPGANMQGGVSSEIGSDTRIAASETHSNLIVKGGNVAIFKFNDPVDWINSLIESDTWEIIEYEEVNSIFDLLEGELRKNVLEALGKRILK
ncbi:713_t:CDS:2, partial [Scutellospora calospora]